MEESKGQKLILQVQVLCGLMISMDLDGIRRQENIKRQTLECENCPI